MVQAGWEQDESAQALTVFRAHGKHALGDGSTIGHKRRAYGMSFPFYT